MAPSGRKNSEGLLARVNFPLYAVHLLTSRYVVVGGGGGSAKTGVSNAFEVYELSHDGKKFIAQEVFRHETGSEVVMNFACYNDGKRLYLVAGQESHCQLYNVTINIVKEVHGTEHQNGEVENNLRRRRSSPQERTESTSSRKKVVFSFKASDSIQTDFSDSEPVQRVVRISWCGRLMATGGADGHLRLWTFPALRTIRDIVAHSREIDDIDFAHHSRTVASLGKDGQTCIWDVKSGKKLHSLSWTPPNGIKFLFKRCRFGVVEENKAKCRLFTVSNSIGQGRSRDAGACLHSWDTDTGAVTGVTSLGEHVSALAVRADGRFLAIGTMFSGSVAIYIAFSLQRVLNVAGAHRMFVTGLEFIPDSGELCSPAEASVLSISVDNKLCVHDLPYRRTLPPWIVMIFIVISLLITFVVCSYFGL